jgi:hypothetical protein
LILILTVESSIPRLLFQDQKAESSEIEMQSPVQRRRGGWFLPAAMETEASLKSVDRLPIANAASAAVGVFAYRVGDEIGFVFERHRRAAKYAEQVIVHRFFHPRLLRNFRYNIHVNRRYGFAFV